MMQAQHKSLFRFSLRLFSFVLLASASMHSAQAQNRSSLLARMEAMEARLDALGAGGGAPSGGAPVSGGSAIHGVEISEIREELRNLRGEVEELNHQQRTTQEQLDLLSKDIDLRLQPLETRSFNAPSNAETTTAPVIDAPSAPVIRDVEEAPAPAAPVIREETPSGDPDSEYKTAFETLNSGNYSEAEQQFGNFINQYPSHQLIGNAHYWLGETYYVQEQFDAAADEFRKGFQEMPQGPKAPDNLLRLGMTLGVLQRQEEACIIFKQLLGKYAGQSQAVERKAKHESGKLGCQ